MVSGLNEEVSLTGKGSAQIALIDDDEDIVDYLQLLLESQGHKVAAFEEGMSFLKSLEHNPDTYDLVLCDYMLPELDGLEVYSHAKQRGLTCPYLLLTAFSDFEVAVNAIKAGVSDYLIKPVKAEIFLPKVASYLQYRSWEEELLFNRLGERVVAHSPAMQEILRKLSRVAKSRASIMLAGESGTGKEVLSRMLHETSPRSQDGNFVAINVSAIPDTLFEAEFFGYRKGAFTGAVRDHDGFARMANNGTLFLDELGEMSLASQAKLLRLLEERKVQSLGANTVHDVDFRVLSATNRDLHTMIETGDFRDDLYYRLAVVTIHIPPLRERPEDIMPLARHLLRDLAQEEELEVTDFTPEAQEVLLSYRWPGNVRELKNRVYEALLACNGQWIEAFHFNLPRGGREKETRNLTYNQAKRDFERSYITRLLKITSGNVNRIAELSGLSRKAVYDMMKRHDISPEGFRPQF